jgi:hypothetical protein
LAALDAKVSIDGLSRFVRTMKAAGANMADMKDANVKAANTVASRARSTGPHRSGNLTGSLRTPRTQARARVTSNLIYAPPIHWGWPKRHIWPNPFVTRAAIVTKPEWLHDYEKSLQKILDSVQGE